LRRRRRKPTGDPTDPGDDQDGQERTEYKFKGNRNEEEDPRPQSGFQGNL